MRNVLLACAESNREVVPPTNDKEEHKVNRLHSNTFLGYSPSIQNHLLLNAVFFVSRAGPAQSLPKRWIGHASLKFTYLGVMFGHDVDHEPTNKPGAGRSNLFFFFSFFSVRNDRYNDSEKYKSGHHLSF